VLEAAGQEDALEKLGSNAIEAVVISNNLPAHGAQQLVEHVRHLPELCGLEVVVVCDTRQEIAAMPASSREVYLEKFDRAGLIESLEHLSRAPEEEKVYEIVKDLVGSAK
jgi:glycine cleavage system regulatory protein